MSDPAAPALAVRWERVCAALAQTEAPAGDTVQSAAQLLWHILAALYAHPPRVYHTLEHVAACLPWLDEARPRMGNVVGVEFALYLHDSVYVPGRADNEARSADVAAMFLTRLGPIAVRHERAVTQLILATRHDGTVLAGDAALLADIDLAILGSLPDNYDAYAAAIREEYGQVDDARYRAGRAQFLRRLLQRARIYHSAWGAECFEAAVRANLGRELAQLAG